MRRTTSPVEILTTDAHDRDWAVYVQDMWKPFERVTLNMGVRVDWVRRYDEIFGIERMNSRNIGPRIGGAFLLTEDARNVVRAFFGRVHEQVNGRDPITTFGPTSRRFQRDIFDTNGDGIFEIEQVTPAATARSTRSRSIPNLHQPLVDEYAVGYARAVPRPDQPRRVGDTPLLQGWLREIDINGIYPDSAPTSRSRGFGLVDPNQRHDHAADQRDLEPGRGHQPRSDPGQEPVAQLPGDGDSHAAMAAHRRHLESRPIRRGSSSPTPSRTTAQLLRISARHLFGNGDDNSLDGGGAESGVAYRPVLVANRGAVLRAVGSAGRSQLRHPGRRLSRTRRGAERHR